PAEDATQRYGAGVISRVGGTPRDPGAVLLRAVTRLRELHGVVRLRLRHRRAWIFRRCPDPRQREEQHGAASERSDSCAKARRVVPARLRPHDRGLPHLAIRDATQRLRGKPVLRPSNVPGPARLCGSDRKSTRLNSSHDQISYAVFCLKKKKKKKEHTTHTTPTEHIAT